MEGKDQKTETREKIEVILIVAADIFLIACWILLPETGMPIEQVQKILGHSQIDTTMQYAMVNQNNVKTSHQKYMS